MLASHFTLRAAFETSFASRFAFVLLRVHEHHDRRIDRAVGGIGVGGAVERPGVRPVAEALGVET